MSLSGPLLRGGTSTGLLLWIRVSTYGHGVIEIVVAYSSSEVVSLAAAVGGGTEAEGFFICPATLAAVLGAALVVVVEGREAVVLVEEASDARGAVRLVDDASAAVRVVRGRFAVVVVAVDEASDGLEVAVFPGDARVAVPDTRGVLRTVGFLFSSPDVTDDNSGSASEVVLDDNAVLLGTVPGAGRVGGLFKLDPIVLVRDVELDSGLVELAVAVRVVFVDGRVALVVAAPGRRGATDLEPARGSLAADDEALEAIFRRTEDVGVEGAGNFFRCGLPAAWGVLEGASAGAGLAGVGASSILSCGPIQGWPAQTIDVQIQSTMGMFCMQ